MQTYADCIQQMGAPLDNCFGFIDGTVRPIARPGMNQRVLYNGHKRVHSLKFQAVAIPNGLIANLHGPVGKLYIIRTYVTTCYRKKITFRSTPNAEFDVIHLYLFCIAEGRKHDSGLLADSGLLPVLEQHAVSPAGHPMCLYQGSRGSLKSLKMS